MLGTCQRGNFRQWALSLGFGVTTISLSRGNIDKLQAWSVCERMASLAKHPVAILMPDAVLRFGWNAAILAM